MKMTMLREVLRAVTACVVTFVLCAVVYPVLCWAIGQTLFRDRAEGSLVRNAKGQTIGSVLIAQPFSDAKYFHPRPSAAGAKGYAADAASGSNLGPNNPALRDRIIMDTSRLIAQEAGGEEVAKLLANLETLEEKRTKKADDKAALAPLEEQIAGIKTKVAETLEKATTSSVKLVPADLVTASGSGLDPDISPEGAQFQAARVASARGMDLEQLRHLIESHTDHSGVLLGNPPRVNVLKLNLALDATTQGK
jgi:K+-transporting ATPase ATPase C chain